MYFSSSKTGGEEGGGGGGRGASWGELTLCVGVQLGRTALHYAAVLTDEGTLYNTLKEAGADETITDSVSIFCFWATNYHTYMR